MDAKTSLSPAMLLRWYLEAGVDEAILENPVDRYRANATAPEGRVSAQPETDEPRRPATRAERQAAFASTTPAAARADSATAPVESAFAVAQRASSLDELRTALAAFEECPLSRTATNLVFGDGCATARIVAGYSRLTRQRV